MAALPAQLGYAIAESDAGERLERLTASDDQAVYVMEEQGVVAGWVHVHGRHFIQSASFAEIGGLVVDGNDHEQ